MNALAGWTSLACAELGIDPGELDRTAVLDLARDVARGVARPAAPLATYLLGVAVGRGLSGQEAAARLSTLADRWRGVDWSD